MKKTILILIIIFTSSLVAEEKTSRKWGYIYHGSKLSDSYLKKTIPTYDVIAMTGWKIDQKGEITKRKKKLIKSVEKLVSNKKIIFYPVLSFKSINSGIKFLNSMKVLKIAASNISRLVNKNRFDGVHIDFEYIPPKFSKKLAIFLNLLKIKLKDKKLSIAIFPQVKFPKKWSDFHNVELISEYVDEIVLMCYDYHRSGTKPGPITEINWAKENIEYVLKYFKPHQVWLGIPAYGYRWSDNQRTSAISAKIGLKQASRYGSIRHSSGNVYYSYTKSQKQYRVYFADKKTRESLSSLSIKNKLAGTALWRLGFED